MLLAGLLATGLPASADDAQPAGSGAARLAPAPQARPVRVASWQAHHGKYFQRQWGVDLVGVRPVSSGYMLRFDYRVLDPERAAVLSDKKARPYLIDEASHIALAVPAMENIGELRQVAPLETGRTYFMVFGNPGKLVKRGSRVTLVVGNLRAEGVVVD